MNNVNANAWKGDNFKFVGKSFDFAYADRLNRLLPILGEVDSKSIDYELSGAGGYGELSPYDGVNLNMGNQKRGFRTIITPQEYSKSDTIGKKAAKVDKLGESRKVGKRLGDTTAMTVYLHALRMFGHAFDGAYVGGDGKAWAAEDHPVASLMDQGRRRLPDPEAGVFSNLIHDTLSVSNITKAQTLAGRYLTPDGVPFLCDMGTLLVSPELEAEAKKICGDNGKLRPTRNPDDNSNAANPLADLNYMVVGGGLDGFTSKQWAICDRRLMKDITKIVYITRPEVLNTELDNPLLDMYTAYVDFGVGWGDARQIIFSNPK